MRLLLDTHALLWALYDHPRLGTRARELFSAPQEELFVSVVSAREMAIKKSREAAAVPAGRAHHRGGFHTFRRAIRGGVALAPAWVTARGILLVRHACPPELDAFAISPSD